MYAKREEDDDLAGEFKIRIEKDVVWGFGTKNQAFADFICDIYSFFLAGACHLLISSR